MTRTLWCCALAFTAACSEGAGTTEVLADTDCSTVGAATGRVPLIDLLDRTYLGFTGGLYPHCLNTLTGSHDSAGLSRA